MKLLLKNFQLVLSLTVLLFCISCSKNDEPSIEDEGSPRDWTYTKDNVQVYIDGVRQASVTEITVKSIQLTDEEEETNPLYDTTLKIKGLEKKNKITNIKVESTIDTFKGTVTYKGSNYVVSGEYVGDPFRTHYSELGIIVNLDLE